MPTVSASFVMLIAALLFAATMGCGGSGALAAARAGNLDDLRRAIDDELASGDLDDADARDIAHAVLETDVAAATGSVDADRLPVLAPCARDLADALDDRAQRADEPGGAAQMLLLDARLTDPEDARHRAGQVLALLDGRPLSASVGIASRWKAVHARTLVGPRDGTARRERFVDGDQNVRLAALRAAQQVADPADVDALLEAARLDPMPLARTAAIRAAGAIGGERVVLGLKDVWAQADDGTREAIADAWSTPASIDTGGRRELMWASETQKGSPSIAAAYALVRAGGAGKTAAIGVLTRAIQSSSTRDRIFAILVSPLGAPPVRDAVSKAADDSDEAVALAALSRLVETPESAGGLPPGSKERAQAIKRLLALGEGATTRALSAKSALARAGAREVLPILERDLRGRDHRARETAAIALATMGELARASRGIAEQDARARAAIACSILSASPGSRR